MKTKHLLAVLLLSIAILAARAAFAAVVVTSPAVTYTFHALPGEGGYVDTSVDGSTITIQNDALTSWNLTYNGADGGSSTNFTPSNSNVLTQNIASYDQNTWAGNFQVGTGPVITFFSPIANDNVPGSFFSGTGSGQNPDDGELDYNVNVYNFYDPYGTWTPASSVPESGSTIALLALGCGALLVASKRFATRG